ncbi:beta-galactosidase-like isoform X2 [Diaphorina citri]|uniref:Beta-galactosidase-like isoform X2 n=1 Tax=Diaphorina citri TaxID=121845 RepID=A0A1S3D0K4_DIACI|nr:beta-galactosidase-like isoform X2 [Diaphorina citri]
MWLPHTRRTLFKLVCCLQTFLIIFVLLTKDKISQRRARMSRTFAIDLAGDTFRLNEDPFQFVSGSFHYFRAPPGRWCWIMRAMRAAGLNALSTYVEWRSHEVHPGHYHYDGHRDIEHFLQLAVEEDLYILLRPGPFNHPVYQRYVTRWFQELFPRIQKYLYGNDRPIILVQVENEYGSDAECDPAHAVWLRDLLRTYVQDKAVLYSTDGAFDAYLRCTVDGVYSTVDFTVFKDVNVSFQAQRTRAPQGPLVNAEFEFFPMLLWAGMS